MSSPKTEDQSKTSKTPGQEELTSGDLDKVVGGLKKNAGIGGPKTNRNADPCEGGE